MLLSLAVEQGIVLSGAMSDRSCGGLSTQAALVVPMIRYLPRIQQLGATEGALWRGGGRACRHRVFRQTGGVCAFAGNTQCPGTLPVRTDW